MAISKNKRILMVTTDHLMIDRRILLEAQTLIEEGYDVRLLAGFECPQPIEYEIDRLKVHRFAYDWSDRRVDDVVQRFNFGPSRLRHFNIRTARKVVSIVTGFTSFEDFVLSKILSFDYDILHCHDFPLLKVSCEAVRCRPVKFVYDAHELYHAQIQLPQKVQKYYRKLERRLIKRPDLVITVNPFIANIMAEDYSIDRPHVLLNATNVKPKDTNDKLRSLTGIPSDDLVLIYQGWMSPERGIDRLIRCATQFPANMHLVLVGYGACEDQLRMLSQEQGTNDGRVVFLGQLSNVELAEITPFADLGAIPYHGVDLNNYYCSPNKLFEFVAAGVPFVCNNLPFLLSIVDEYGCGVTVNFSDTEEAGNTIVQLMRDPKALAKMKANTILASTKLNWTVEGEKLLGLYSAVLSR